MRRDSEKIDDQYSSLFLEPILDFSTYPMVIVVALSILSISSCHFPIDLVSNWRQGIERSCEKEQRVKKSGKKSLNFKPYSPINVMNLTHLQFLGGSRVS